MQPTIYFSDSEWRWWTIADRVYRTTPPRFGCNIYWGWVSDRGISLQFGISYVAVDALLKLIDAFLPSTNNLCNSFHKLGKIDVHSLAQTVVECVSIKSVSAF